MSVSGVLARYPSLEGKLVFITDEGLGIGESIADAFAEQGAQVAFVDIAVEPGLAVCERITMAGYGKPVFRQLNIRGIPALQSTVGLLADDIRGFDVLVNNAGNDQRHNPEEVTVEARNNIIAINQRPMF